jgi:hypothetical protein
MRSAYERTKNGHAPPPSCRPAFEELYSYEAVGREFVKILQNARKEDL